METEFTDRGCGYCEAPAKFLAPCVERELAGLVGEDQVHKWTETCREQHRLWKSFANCADVVVSEGGETKSLPGSGMLGSLLRIASWPLLVSQVEASSPGELRVFVQ